MKGDATMKQKTTIEQAASTVCYEMIEAKARERIQSWLQGLLEEEVTEFLGRGKSQRRSRGRGGLSQRLWQAQARGPELGYGECASSAAEEFGGSLRESSAAVIQTAQPGVRGDAAAAVL